MVLYMTYSASSLDRVDDKMNGYYPIRTREELDKIIATLGSYNRIIIRKSFANDNFTPQSLADYISNCSLINPNVIFDIDSETEMYTVNNFVERMLAIDTIEELIDIAIQDEKQFFACYKSLTSNSNDMNMRLSRSGSTLSKQKEANDALRQELDDVKHELSIERRNKVHLVNTLDSLIGRINNQYGGAIDKKKLFMQENNRYDRVLYIKELTRVQYTDSLLYYLKEILKVVYKMPVRLLVIESYYATGKVQLYKDLTPHFELKEKDVISGDILMLGVQPKLMMDILKNPSNISMLIVMDRAGYGVPHIIDDNVEYFYTMSDLDDKPLNVPDARVISYSNETLNIPLIKGFDKLDQTGKMGHYSSLPIVKKIIELLSL